MQPVAYLAMRCCITWLQFLEGDRRAFLCSAQVAATTGPVHCWSIVYALFIAIHIRAYRNVGHADYHQSLPFWLQTVENISVLSTAVWWVASCGMGFVRIVNEDTFGLPMSRHDTAVPGFIRAIQSKTASEILRVAHMLSGIALLFSVMFLCCALPLMTGEITTSEVCSVLVSFSFAAAHCVVAVVSSLESTGDRRDTKKDQGGALAVAMESGSLGPQLCVVLALANVRGVASSFDKAVYLAATAGFLASLVVCGMAPPKRAGLALRPETSELITCVLLDVAALATLIICFPPLNNWPLRLLILIFILLCALAALPDVRGPLMEVMEPIMPIRTGGTNSFSARNTNVRDAVRLLSRLFALICVAVVLWDLAVNSAKLQQQQAEPEYTYKPPEYPQSSYDGDYYSHHEHSYGYEHTYDHDDDHYSHDYSHDHDYSAESSGDWPREEWLLMRWQASAETQITLEDGLGASPSEDDLLETIAEALHIQREELAVEELNRKHRVLVFMHFGHTGAEDGNSVNISERWRDAVLAPVGKLATIVDSTFPAEIDTDLCFGLPHEPFSQYHPDDAEGTMTTTAEFSESIHEVLHSIEPSAAREAYAAACKAWRRHWYHHYGDHGGYHSEAGYDEYHKYDDYGAREGDGVSEGTAAEAADA